MKGDTSRSIAIVRADYFPGLDTAAAMLAVDVVVVADSLQYSRQSCNNRCRIRTPTDAMWLTIPVARGQHGRSVADTSVRGGRWRRHHLKALEFNYSSGPYWLHYADEIAAVVNLDSTLLGDFCFESIALVSELLGGKRSLVRASSPDDRRTVVPDDTIFEAAVGPVTALPVQVAGGVAHPIRVAPIHYPQNFPGFVGGLSALDLLLNCGPEGAGLLANATLGDRPGGQGPMA